MNLGGQRSRDTDHVTRYQTTGHYFFLVQAEILAALHTLTRGNLAPGMHDVPAADRAVIADAWLAAFNR